MGHQEESRSRSGVKYSPQDRELIADRLRQARWSSGLSQAEAAAAVGVAPNTIYRYEAGRAVPRPQTLTALSRLYGRTEQWLRGGPEADYGPGWHLAADPVTGQEPDVQVVVVPVACTVAGTGSFGFDGSPRDWLPYRQDRLARAGMNHNSCRLVEIRGDAMGPGLPGRALVLVDLNRRGLWDGRLYLMEAGEEGLVVRRVFQEGRAWLVRGDHADSRPRPFHETWTVHGEVRGVIAHCG